ncbi:unnamed protein product [[Actinomadura] parvosata subsp. kistnae]|nr:unnamed protein product [Actinomadura parvosata subsp. kistnae]
MVATDPTRSFWFPTLTELPNAGPPSVPNPKETTASPAAMLRHNGSDRAVGLGV